MAPGRKRNLVQMRADALEDDGGILLGRVGRIATPDRMGANEVCG